MKPTPYQEALRYLQNAKDTLQKAGKDGKDYADIKYVKTAAVTAYGAVLLALDEYLRRKEGTKFVKPKSIDDYRIRISKQNKTLKSLLNSAYDTLHLAGYYHGTTSYNTIKRGFEDAYKIVEYIHN
ncbi:hypothetical protein C7N43_36885 [Sphingobacteriales bacterium UPWRP_1]|nr:hypothetical protein B6N25_09470 [Sphingobacteriales bacterium TSM_CSS]PSJ71911.1 hypothetical protein C7N43_36885 [Sphingobacteriales bacterium UPWRP_1]